MTTQSQASFEWDAEKDRQNQEKHNVSFIDAQYAFADPKRIILKDLTHTTAEEERFYCLGCVEQGIITVRFTYREGKIRIFGAGYWRKGKRLYDQQNHLH